MKADREIWLVAVQRYAGNFSPLCETDYYGRNEVIPWEFCFDLEIVSEALKGRPAESSPWSNENSMHLLLGRKTDSSWQRSCHITLHQQTYRSGSQTSRKKEQTVVHSQW